MNEIRSWLGAGIKPDEIAILYRALPQDSHSVFTQFVRKLENLAPVYWRNGKIGAPQGAITLCTMHSCKGLQWRAVLILWADLLPYGREPEQWKLERGLMYVAMTLRRGRTRSYEIGIFAIQRRNRGSALSCRKMKSNLCWASAESVTSFLEGKQVGNFPRGVVRNASGNLDGSRKLKSAICLIHLVVIVRSSPLQASKDVGRSVNAE